MDLFVGMPTCCAPFGDPTFQIWMTHVPARSGQELLSYSGGAISMCAHTGTHLDTLNHFGLQGRIWNQVSTDEAFGMRGWTRSGADKYPRGLAGRPVEGPGVRVPVHPMSRSSTTTDRREGMAAKLLEPIHAGEILYEEFMKPMGISINALAREVAVPPDRISDIVNRKRSITADTALRLGKYFGVSPELWLNLQVDYDLRVARRTTWLKAEPRVRVHAD